MIHFLIYTIFEAYKIVILSKEGYEVKLFFIKKFYPWSEIETKICEDYTYKGKRAFDTPKVKKNIIFCKEKITKSKTQEPRDYLLWRIHLFSFFSILLTDLETANEKNYSVNYLRMDEYLFKKKMKEWNIEIEGM